MICPQCRSVDCYRSHRTGVVDFLWTLVGMRAWKCQTCDKRFHARRVASSFVTYAHCPRCGNFDLEQISGDRVEEGTLVTLKRYLNFAAYRCDPCRQRFFSILPYKRILPATVSHLDRRRIAS